MKQNGQTSKIATIIKHEYMIKFKSKGFIISTIFGPLMLIAFIGIMILVTVLSEKSTDRKIAILDKTGKIGEKVVKLAPDKYFLANESADKLMEQTLNETIDGYLLIPEDFLKEGNADVFSRGGGGIGFITSLKSNVGRILRHERLLEAGADMEVIRLAESGVNIRTQKITESGSETDFAEMYAALGYLLGFGIYMMVFIYGAMVMRGVIEEKTNRIVEVIASSAKPFEIMMGKVIGIGALGLTQITIWASLAMIIFLLKADIIGMIAPSTQAMAANPMMASDPHELQAIMNMPAPSIFLILGFAFYFLAGYFIYSTLFAAVGSAVDQESDAQQLQLPVTLPIIIPIMFTTFVMSNPDGIVSVVMSLIPFFSPILMIVRIAATDVPVWQILASIALMILTFIGAISIAARIYRVGILMYGKKPSFKELFKWVRLAK